MTNTVIDEPLHLFAVHGHHRLPLSDLYIRGATPGTIALPEGVDRSSLLCSFRIFSDIPLAEAIAILGVPVCVVH